MRALVTGGAGFIGAAVARALVERGDDVRVLDNLATGFRDNLPSGAEFVEGDLRDLDAVLRAAKDVEVIFHQGALRSVERSVDAPIDSNAANVTGTMNVLVAAREAGTRRVVYASSSSVYGDPDEPLRREDQAVDPISPYGVSKLAGEMYARAWTRVYGLSTVALRYFNVFGPRQPRESRYALVIPAFIGALVDGKAPEIHGDGEQSRDFTYIDDVVAANLLSAGAGPEVDGAVLNVGGGHARTVNEVLRSVSNALGRWMEPVFLPRRAGDVRHTLADISRARRLLGWEPKAVWDGAIAETTRWFGTPR